MRILLVILSLCGGLLFSLSALAHDSSASRKPLPGKVCEALLEGLIAATPELVRQRLTQIETFWTEKFAQRGLAFKAPTLRVFDGETMSSAGLLKMQMGPLYSPMDRSIFIDPTFLNHFKDQIGPPTDAGLTSILAHEVGHHIQKLLNAYQKGALVTRRAGLSDNEFSVLLELQADCLSGMFMGSLYRRGFATRDQIDETFQRFALLGVDMQHDIKIRLGIESTPHQTHPQSDQRSSWFERGINASGLNECEPFAVPVLL
jgi:predicted metalloprotease